MSPSDKLLASFLNLGNSFNCTGTSSALSWPSISWRLSENVALSSSQIAEAGMPEPKADTSTVIVQVAPFILRRTKDAVLKDLPPKILQDIYCNLSLLQHALYNEFSSSQAADAVASVTEDSPASGIERVTGSAPHIFQV